MKNFENRRYAAMAGGATAAVPSRITRFTTRVRSRGWDDSEENQVSRLLCKRPVLFLGMGRSGKGVVLGHRTPSVFQRYNIVDEEDLNDAVRKLAVSREGAICEAKRESYSM